MLAGRWLTGQGVSVSMGFGGSCRIRVAPIPGTYSEYRPFKARIGSTPLLHIMCLMRLGWLGKDAKGVRGEI